MYASSTPSGVFVFMTSSFQDVGLCGLEYHELKVNQHPEHQTLGRGPEAAGVLGENSLGSNLKIH